MRERERGIKYIFNSICRFIIAIHYMEKKTENNIGVQKIFLFNVLTRAGTVWVTFTSGHPGTAERRMIAIATDMQLVCGPSASTVPLTTARMLITTRVVPVP